MIVSSETIARIGLLDESYFAYWEDSDWYNRGWRIGCKSIYVPKARIWHKVSSSRNTETKVLYMTRNRLWLMRKHAHKAKGLLGWEPKVKFKELVKIMVEADLKLAAEESRQKKK